MNKLQFNILRLVLNMQGGILAKKFIGARKEQEMSKNSPKKIEEKIPSVRSSVDKVVESSE